MIMQLKTNNIVLNKDQKVAVDRVKSCLTKFQPFYYTVLPEVEN